MPAIPHLVSQLDDQASHCTGSQLTAYKQEISALLGRHVSAVNDRESPLPRLPTGLRLEIAKLVMATLTQDIGVPAGMETALGHYGVLRTCHRLRCDFMRAFFSGNVFVVHADLGCDLAFTL